MHGQDQLVSLEERFWEAAGDPDFYREHFADDGLMALPVGLMTKPQVVQAMESASEWSDYTIDDLRWVDVGDDVAALVYTTTAKRDDSDGTYRAAVTSVYVNRGGEWQLVLHQQTPL
jgi:Domain of unknown function (DUF4440)